VKSYHDQRISGNPWVRPRKLSRRRTTTHIDMYYSKIELCGMHPQRRITLKNRRFRRCRVHLSQCSPASEVASKTGSCAKIPRHSPSRSKKREEAATKPSRCRIADCGWVLSFHFSSNEHSLAQVGGLAVFAALTSKVCTSHPVHQRKVHPLSSVQSSLGPCLLS
jgi:hypothetical protein